MFDDFDLFVTCEEYYNDVEKWEAQQAFEDMHFELSDEDQTELDALFG